MLNHNRLMRVKIDITSNRILSKKFLHLLPKCTIVNMCFNSHLLRINCNNIYNCPY